MLADSGQELLPRFLTEPVRLLIDGEFVSAQSEETLPAINPATGETIAEIPRGDAGDIDRAVGAARRALEGPWGSAKPAERQRVLLRFADLVEDNYDEIFRLDVLDMGRPIRSLARSRAIYVDQLRYFAAMAVALHGETIQNSLPGEILTHTRLEPVGVVGAIIPWNGPHGMTIWKAGAALATGCTIVIKPAEQASLSPLLLGRLALEAGVPPGVFNVVTGLGPDAGAALAEHPDVAKISFTGSHLVGQEIVRASAGNLKRVTLELGGKSPDIVFADADLEQAAQAAAMGVFANAGQVCFAGTRLFVEEPVFDEFVKAVCEIADGLKVGNGLDPQTEMGPLVSARQLERVQGYLDDATDQGANVASNREIADEGLEGGYFIRPTVLTQVADHQRVATEEIFGPVVCALPFTSEDEVVRRANATQFGLAGGVFTRDLARANRVVNRLHVGTSWINCYGLLDPAVPFGGVKMSGYGREGGRQHLDDYLSIKSVYTNASR